jgi:diadenylate cyclase
MKGAVNAPGRATLDSSTMASLCALVWISWHRIADFTVLVCALYIILRWARNARATRLALASLGFYLLSIAARRVDLIVTSWVLLVGAVLLGVSILLAFQSEFRSTVLRLEALFRRGGITPSSDTDRALAESAFELANLGLGALIVVRRRDVLEEITRVGTPFGARVSPQVLLSIFQKTSPLHDGAAVVEGDRILSVNVVLPLSRRVSLPVQYGTRHRAALGMTEHGDATVIVVSEETREVRLVSRGAMQLMRSREELTAKLREYAKPRETKAAFVRKLIFGDPGLKVAAVLFALLIWVVTYVGPTTVVRTLEVPIEFRGVPPGLRITRQSADHIEAELRGNAWLLDSVERGGVVARLEISGAKEGVRQLRVSTQAIDLPPGVVVDHIAPPAVSVTLEK